MAALALFWLSSGVSCKASSPETSVRYESPRGFAPPPASMTGMTSRHGLYILCAEPSTSMTVCFCSESLSLESTNADMHAGAAEVAGLSPFAFSVIVGTVATLPLMFIPSFKKLSWLSLLGCISTVVVTVTVMAAVAMDPLREQMPQQVCLLDLWHCAPVPLTDLVVTLLCQCLHSLCPGSYQAWLLVFVKADGSPECQDIHVISRGQMGFLLKPEMRCACSHRLSMES